MWKQIGHPGLVLTLLAGVLQPTFANTVGIECQGGRSCCALAMCDSGISGAVGQSCCGHHSFPAALTDPVESGSTEFGTSQYRHTGCAFCVVCSARSALSPVVLTQCVELESQSSLAGLGEEIHLTNPRCWFSLTTAVDTASCSHNANQSKLGVWLN